MRAKVKEISNVSKRPLIRSINVKKKPKNFAAFFAVILCALCLICALQFFALTPDGGTFTLMTSSSLDTSTEATTLKDILDYENGTVFNRSGYKRPLFDSLKLKQENDPNLFSDELYDELNTFMPDKVLLPGKAFVVLVVTSPKHFETRSFIRSTWGTKALQQRFKFQVIFMMGQQDVSVDYNPGHDFFLSRLEKERLQHEDMISGGYIDTYANLTLKSMSILYFTAQSMARMSKTIFMKMDDDVVFDVYEFVKRSELVNNTDRFADGFACNVINWAGVIRERGHRWFVSEENWSDWNWPSYCDGPVYLFYPIAAHRIVEVLRPGQMKFIWIEDAFVTGVLAELAAVPRQNWLSWLGIYSKSWRKGQMFTHVDFAEERLKRIEVWSHIRRRERIKEERIAAEVRKKQEAEREIKLSEERLRNATKLGSLLDND